MGAAVGLSAKAGFTGLMTQVGEMLAPQGALRVADNVDIRKPGLIEPRPALLPISQGYSAPSAQFLSAGQAGGTAVYEAVDDWRNSAGATLRTTLVIDPNTFVTTEGKPPKFRADSFSTASLRGNMYLPYKYGTLKLESSLGGVAGTTRWGESGLSNLYVYNIQIATDTTVTPLILPPDSHVSYRFVGKRTDSNRLVIRSAPTGAFLVENSGGSIVSVAPRLQVGVRSSGILGDQLPPYYWHEVEIYRSRVFPVSAQIDDEHALVGVVDLTQLVAGFGLYVFTDRVPDSARGQALYTSPSRHGIEGSNERPPACAFVESFRGAMFYGNVAGPQRIIFSYNWSDDGAGVGIAGKAGGIGARLYTGNTTAGSPTITSLSSTVGLQKGMVALNGFTFEAYITNISGSTITMSGNASVTASGANITFSDAIEIGGRWHGLFPGTFTGLLALSVTGQYWGSYGLSPPERGYNATFVVETYYRNVDVFGVRATHGNEMSPPLPLYGETPRDSEMDAYPNGFIYSNVDEPEHVPPKNFFFAGDRARACLGMKATRDSLFLFKEDGIWRVSGINNEWRVDPFDLTTFCVLPSSLQRLNGRIYMLANQGVVRVSELGVEIVSEPIRDQVARLVDDCRANFAALGYYKLTGVGGCASAVDDRNGRYILLTGSNVLESGGNALVFNEATNAWTTYSFKPGSSFAGYTASGMGVHANGSPLVLHTGGARAPSYAETTLHGEAVPIAHDGSAAITITLSAPSGTSVTLNYTPGTQLAVDDVVVDLNGGHFRVTSAPSNVSCVVDVTGIDAAFYPALGAGTAYRAIRCTVQPHGFSDPSLTGKLWTHAVWAFSRLLGPLRVLGNFSSAEPTVDETTQTISEEVTYRKVRGSEAGHHLGTLLRHPIPVVHRRSWLLRAKISWVMAFGKVALELFGAESRENQTNRDQSNSSGAT